MNILTGLVFLPFTRLLDFPSLSCLSVGYAICRRSLPQSPNPLKNTMTNQNPNSQSRYFAQLSSIYSSIYLPTCFYQHSLLLPSFCLSVCVCSIIRNVGPVLPILGLSSNKRLPLSSSCCFKLHNSSRLIFQGPRKEAKQKTR